MPHSLSRSLSQSQDLRVQVTRNTANRGREDAGGVGRGSRCGVRPAGHSGARRRVGAGDGGAGACQD